jgi:hypothetical protein
MAITAREIQRQATEPAVVMREVKAPAALCGECAYHMPHATRPGGWCAKADADLRWQPVSAQREACGGFATWPEGSAAPAFLAAMRF